MDWATKLQQKFWNKMYLFSILALPHAVYRRSYFPKTSATVAPPPMFFYTMTLTLLPLRDGVYVPSS